MFLLCVLKSVFLGLVRTTSVKILDFEEFSTWNKVRIEIGKVVEAITAPGKSFT